MHKNEPFQFDSLELEIKMFDEDPTKNDDLGSVCIEIPSIGQSERKSFSLEPFEFEGKTMQQGAIEVAFYRQTRKVLANVRECRVSPIKLKELYLKLMVMMTTTCTFRVNNIFLNAGKWPKNFTQCRKS